MSIRIAVIGAGIMGADHARIVAGDLPGASLQVVCDLDEARARSVADACGAADIATDPEATVSRDDVDAVIVASPDFTHAPLSMACIRAARPVLCEKPLSHSSAECLEVIEAETQSARQWVQLGFMRRYDQSYIEMKAALDSGRLGRPLMMHNFHRNPETPAADFTPAMAISNSAPHEFDAARYVLGTEFVSISAYQPRRSDSLVAPVFMVMETTDGQLVNIEVNNNAAYGYDVRGELVGEKASISLHAPAYSLLDGDLRRTTEYAADWRPRFAEAYRRQDKDFVEFVNTGRFPAWASNCWDGYCAALIAEAGVRALTEGRAAPIELIDKPAMYGK
jgi:myo-inositol 2-dehydrogenase/D-chiro-inositol 1-dehydrogenase